MKLEITPIVRGTVMFRYENLVVYIDPVSKPDYTTYPKADLILLTHHHSDHVDKDSIDKLKKPETVIVGTKLIEEMISGIIVMNNGDEKELFGLSVEAFPMYNVVKERSPGVKFHARGEGNAYIIDFGKTRVYVAGDTECIQEMKKLSNIDVAFIPIFTKATMSPEEAAECVQVFKPKIVYPYHQGGSDPTVFAKCLEDS
jgi:L-ascorbate metabolism protein UlaG (beta-lactamase superfamily)